jgi:hypothetical protein
MKAVSASAVASPGPVFGSQPQDSVQKNDEIGDDPEKYVTLSATSISSVLVC